MQPWPRIAHWDQAGLLARGLCVLFGIVLYVFAVRFVSKLTAHHARS